MRQSGFYWVKYRNIWIIVEFYSPRGAWIHNDEGLMYDNDFDQIDERRIIRQEE